VFLRHLHSLLDANKFILFFIYRAGWDPTDSTLTQTKPKFCGLRQVGVSITYQHPHCWSTPAPSVRCCLFERFWHIHWYDLSMRTHVTKKVSRCFATTLRQLRQFRRSVPVATLQTLVVALIHSRLDYGNAVLVGIPTYLQRRLQSAARWAWLMYRLGYRYYITDARISLHWLRVPERIKYNVAVLAIQNSPQRCAALPWATRPCCWHTWSVRTSLCCQRPPGGPLCMFTHSRQQDVSDCHPEGL